jgi:hypothetical protein
MSGIFSWWESAVLAEGMAWIVRVQSWVRLSNAWPLSRICAISRTRFSTISVSPTSFNRPNLGTVRGSSRWANKFKLGGPILDVVLLDGDDAQNGIFVYEGSEVMYRFSPSRGKVP